ncbi:MAG TPA: hypothetical protein VLJ38_00980 [Polyangiaceae bacterium]|nr:hypothetical protein [Polyangiaceae bacterium]
MKPSLSAFVTLVCASLLSGCRSCSDEKPYTPFGTTTALPAPEPGPSGSSTPSAPSASASAAPAAEKSVLAPAGSQHWQLGEQSLDAPPGYDFEQGIQATFGARTPETVAWLAPDATDAGPRAAGELWLFPTSGAPRRLAAVPGFVPSGPGCKLVTALARTGPRTLTFDTQGECAGSLIARSPVRALVVVAPDADPPELLSLRAALPAPGETLDFSVDTSDRDGDGRDDIAVEVSGGAAGTKASAPFVWFDRPAGPSRDSGEPGRTLARVTAALVSRAKTKKLVEDVALSTSNVRRLLASICAEGATPRLLDLDANPLSCGALAPVLDSLATSEVTAELTGGRVLEAFGALARDGWYFGKTSASVHQKLERLVLEAIEPATAVVKVLEPLPAGLERAPRYSPLAFDAAGGVLVQTVAGVVRTEPDGSSPSAPDPAKARPLDVFPAPGQRWAGVTYSCDRSEVMLSVEGAQPLVTALLSARPGVCGHAPFWSSATPPPVSAGGGKIRAIVGGSVVGDAAEQPVPLGAARSADGKWTVVPTSFGLLVDGPVHRLVNVGASVPAPATLTDCVVHTTGKAVACVHKRQALLFMIP